MLHFQHQSNHPSEVPNIAHPLARRDRTYCCAAWWVVYLHTAEAGDTSFATCEITSLSLSIGPCIWMMPLIRISNSASIAPDRVATTEIYCRRFFRTGLRIPSLFKYHSEAIWSRADFNSWRIVLEARPFRLEISRYSTAKYDR